MKNLNRILRLQDSITRLALVRRLIDQAWPEVVGNQPEFSQDLEQLYTKINWLQDIANIKFKEAVEHSLHADAVACACKKTHVAGVGEVVNATACPIHRAGKA